MLQKNIDQAISRLCQSCGFCCNGTLFTRVPLTDEDALMMTAETNSVSSSASASQFRQQPDEFLLHYDTEASRTLDQPCRFLQNSCTIYNKRPVRCREYECRLILRIRSGAIDVGSASKVLTKAVELYHRLNERLGTANRSVDFWAYMRRFAHQSMVNKIGVYSMMGIDPKTVPLLQEFVDVLETYFESTSIPTN